MIKKTETKDTTRFFEPKEELLKEATKTVAKNYSSQLEKQLKKIAKDKERLSNG